MKIYQATFDLEFKVEDETEALALVKGFLGDNLGIQGLKITDICLRLNHGTFVMRRTQGGEAYANQR